MYCEKAPSGHAAGRTRHHQLSGSAITQAGSSQAVVAGSSGTNVLVTPPGQHVDVTAGAGKVLAMIAEKASNAAFDGP